MTPEEFEQYSKEPCTLGVDPGATYTAWTVIHEGTKEVLLSSTVKNKEKIMPVIWGITALNQAKAEIADFNITRVAIESVVAPNAYHQGKMNLMNPKHTIFTGVVVGIFASNFIELNPVMVRPGKNGSQPLDTYPDELKGRRPKTLAGENKSGTRDHERSSYDVGMRAEQHYNEGYIFDSK